MKRVKDKNVVLLDVLDRLFEKGVVVRGEVSLRLADVDLVFVGLQLLITSVSKVKALEGIRADSNNVPLTEADTLYLAKLDEEIKKAEKAIPKVIEGNTSSEIEKGLATLVLSIVELLRRLMEKEAVRQVKMQCLNTKEKQKLGMALKALSKKMELLQATFDLSDDDLNLDLGPLGNLYEV
jgi:hypothetical protein